MPGLQEQRRINPASRSNARLKPPFRGRCPCSPAIYRRALRRRTFEIPSNGSGRESPVPIRFRGSYISLIGQVSAGSPQAGLGGRRAGRAAPHRATATLGLRNVGDRVIRHSRLQGKTRDPTGADALPPGGDGAPSGGVRRRAAGVWKAFFTDSPFIERSGCLKGCRVSGSQGSSRRRAVCYQIFVFLQVLTNPSFVLPPCGGVRVDEVLWRIARHLPACTKARPICSENHLEDELLQVGRGGVTEKALRMHRRGVRQIFVIFYLAICKHGSKSIYWTWLALASSLRF